MIPSSKNIPGPIHSITKSNIANYNNSESIHNGSKNTTLSKKLFQINNFVSCKPDHAGIAGDFPNTGRQLQYAAWQLEREIASPAFTKPIISWKINNAAHLALSGLYGASGLNKNTIIPGMDAVPPVSATSAEISRDIPASGNHGITGRGSDMILENESPHTRLIFVKYHSHPVTADSLYYYVSLPDYAKTTVSPQPESIRHLRIEIRKGDSLTMLDNLNPGYYGRGKIGHLRKWEDISNYPFSQQVVKIGNDWLPVRLRTFKGHGIKYEVYDNKDARKSYSISFSEGEWKLGIPVIDVLGDEVRAIITPELYDNTLQEDDLSAPSRFGVRWNLAGKPYLTTRQGFFPVKPGKSNIHFYITLSNLAEDVEIMLQQGLFQFTPSARLQLIRYHVKIPERLPRPAKAPVLKRQDIKRLVNRKEVFKVITVLNDSLKRQGANKLPELKNIVGLTTFFLKSIFKMTNHTELLNANSLDIQRAWLRNIIIPLQVPFRRTQQEYGKFKKLFLAFLEKLSRKVIGQRHSSLFRHICNTIAELATITLPHYAGTKKITKVLHSPAIKNSRGIPLGTIMIIKGNQYFINKVSYFLKNIAKTPSGRMLINALSGTPLNISPPVLDSVIHEYNGRFFAGNNAENGISFDPDNTLIVVENDMDKQIQSIHSPIVGLYHALRHVCYQRQTATADAVPDDNQFDVEYEILRRQKKIHL